MATKIYIAGKITGDPDYKAKFNAAAEAYKKAGYIVLNPSWMPENMQNADYMRLCFAMIDTADVVAFLPGYRLSAGAQLELQYCFYIDKDVKLPDDELADSETERKTMNRADILHAAKMCVCGERERDYGAPEDNFALIAAMWTVYLSMPITPKDVAMMMALLKIARIKQGEKTDSYIDLAGYAACAGEIAEKEGGR